MILLCLLSFTGAKVAPDETRLLFYSLSKQATQGQCKEPKPWGWNAVENAKWQSWSQLGNMSKEEAMRLFVRTLEELQVGDAHFHRCDE